MGAGDDPREVLRSFLERVDDSPTDLVTGPLHTLVRHTGAVERDTRVLSTTLEWQEATTRETSDAEVEIDFRAARTILLRTPLGDVTKTDWYSGPALMRLEARRWKVVDYKRNGIAMLEQIRVPEDVEISNEGVTIRPLVFEDAPDALRAILHVRNGTDENIWVHEVALRDRYQFMRLAELAVDLDIEPNKNRNVRAVWVSRRAHLREPTIRLPFFLVDSQRWRIAAARSKVAKPEHVR